MIHKCITGTTKWPHCAILLFLNRANIYFRPTGYYIKNPHRADGKAACQQKKRWKKKKTTLSLLKASWTVGNNWKLKPPTLCTCILDGPQKHPSTAPLLELQSLAHFRSHAKDYIIIAHRSSKGVEVDVVLSWNQ